MNNPKVRIFYIHYNAEIFEPHSRDPNKRRPELFSYENCFLNLLQTVRASRYKDRVTVTIWFDGTEEELKRDFIVKQVPADINMQFVLGEHRGGTKSCMALARYVASAKFNPSDLIYCLENDYSHQPDWLDKTIDLFNSNIEFDYLSLYDHADNYNLPIHKSMHTELFFTNSHIWRTALSTCWSFITRHSTFCHDLPLILNNEDFILFVKLSLLGRKLLVATPGLSTHGMLGLESPAVDWRSIRRQASAMQNIAISNERPV
jgi:hypothetical protein